jgi:AmmeMemoRadiSam system protein A
VDREVAQILVAADDRIEIDREAFQLEHPVENQLPFIQAACPGARIIPIVIRQPSLENAQLLAEGLVKALSERIKGGKALIVASTDLSHYHPYEEAQRMDEVALQAIVSLDPKAVADSPRRCAELGLGGGDPLTMCSQGAVMTALIAAQRMGADQATVLHYANSGDVPIGQRDQVVGYGAVALWQSAAHNPGSPTPTAFSIPNLEGIGAPDEPLPLSGEAQQELLAMARRTAEQFLANETVPAFETRDPALLQPMGAYVTYEEDGVLRGCLGRLEGDRPAYLNVQYAALAAALADPRFPAVTAEELDELTLEITLLYPMQQVESPDEIKIGRDGVLMRVGEQDGALFLPQVPLDQGWDLEDTLVQLCRKAGLPDDAWQRPDARFYTFAGQWFGEER